MPRVFDPPAGSYFLFGPRGTGKSTWLRARYPDAAWIDLLDAEAERHYYTRPERLKEFVAAHAGRRTIVIDEIQRVPQLLPLVHQHLESDKSTRFVLTGSSARKLRRSGVDLLAGRAVLCAVDSFGGAAIEVPAPRCVFTNRRCAGGQVRKRAVAPTALESTT